MAVITLPRKLGPQCPHCGSKHTGLIRISHSRKNTPTRHLCRTCNGTFDPVVESRG